MRRFMGMVDRVWRTKWVNKRCDDVAIFFQVGFLKLFTVCGALVKIDSCICCNGIYCKDGMFQLAWLCRISRGFKVEGNFGLFTK